MADSQASDFGSGKKWYVSDMGRIYGPMSWHDVASMVDRAQVTPFAGIRQETWPQWAPITYYFRIKTKTDREVEALIPSRYDALFYLGVFVFFIGVFGFFVMPAMGIVILILSPVIEVLAIYLEIKSKGMTVAGTIGNVIAIFWIVIQIMVTIMIIGMVF